MDVGIIGTGLLGSAIARRLATSHTVRAYNRTREKATPLEKFGIHVDDSPMALAKKSDLVLTIVRDAAAIEDVAFGKNGIVHGNHSGLTVADMSTISPVSSKKIAKKFADAGIMMIDSPVMGGPSLAEKGQMVVMVGGKKEAYEKCKPVLGMIGEKAFHLGDNGSGHAMKIAMNSQIAILALAISEGIILARKSGLDPLTFLDVLNSTYFKTGMSVNKGPRMARGDFEPSFFLRMMQKDLDEIEYTAKEFGAKLPMSEVANKIYKMAVNDGFGDIDYTGILSYLEKSA